MGLFDKLKGEFIDIVEWLDPTNDTMVYRFERYQNEIKNGAKLVVRETQNAVFVNEGKLADIFKPGMYQLTTQNLPVLSTIRGWKYGFNSPFKAEVYFVNMKTFTNKLWGTPNPIAKRDAEFGMIRIGAKGNYTMKVTNIEKFMLNIVGTDGHFTTDEIADQLRNIIVTRFTDAVSESKISVLDLPTQIDELSDAIHKKIRPEFDEYGIDLNKFLIENFALPPNIEAAIDKRTSMNILGDMNKYTQFQAAESMTIAAANPSGGAGEGMGLGMGFGMANQMMNSMNQQQQQQKQQQQTPVPPPLPGMSKYYVVVNGQQAGPYDMNILKQMVAQNQFQKATLVWKEGFANWAKAGDVIELAEVFNTMPPPIPPPIA